MRSASVSLELSLFRRQKAQLAGLFAKSSPALARYEARYRRRTRTCERFISARELTAQLLAADVVYVGDYHTLPAAQRTYLQLAQLALRGGRPLVLALELFAAQHQRLVDAYLAGRLSEASLIERAGLAGPTSLWPGFRPILEWAKAQRVPTIALDTQGRTRKPGDRDRFAADRLTWARGHHPGARVLVLAGEFHVAPCHLPAEVEAQSTESVRQLVIYQNCEHVFWSAARSGRQAPAAQLRPGELCVLNASPTQCLQSFLDFIQPEPGDLPLAGEQLGAEVRGFARTIGDIVGVDVRRPAAGLGVASPGNMDALARCLTRADLSPRDRRALRAQVLRGESCYIPRARLVYLARQSLTHAAEEAAHFVRDCALGTTAMDAARPIPAAFYARSLEEALAYFGSKLLNPTRRCPELPDWACTFTEGNGEDRQVAAFVLAHLGAEKDRSASFELLPLRSGKLFEAVSHALGYLLGAKLYRAYRAGRLPRRELARLFRDPFLAPRDAYFELARRFSRWGPTGRSAARIG